MEHIAKLMVFDVTPVETLQIASKPTTLLHIPSKPKNLSIISGLLPDRSVFFRIGPEMSGSDPDLNFDSWNGRAMAHNA